ncbi:hypothetical protein [Pedobacter faecalis]|uniref:hypothetical protein n=1 Tax=Pedobacter faecalis TaxID=3041495 RepID=UPI00254DDF52|nr:hypothetical protein [Pedobacter sp. ELA7]
MKNIYYLIWVDAILSFKKHNPRNKNWNWTVFFINTHMNSLNFWVVFMAIKYLADVSLPLTELNLFPGHLLDDFFNFTISFASPFVVLNYFLIFHNDRYEKLIKKYGKQNIKYALIYSMISALSALAVALVHGVVNGILI